MQEFQPRVRSSWSIFGEHIPKEKRARLNISDFMNTSVTDAATLKVRWEGDLIGKNAGSLVVLPEYYKLVKSQEENGTWVAVPASEVPKETGLHDVSFDRPFERSHTYVTPEEKESAWKTPGPAA